MIKFVGLSPGPFPVGRRSLFRVNDKLVMRSEIASLGFDAFIPEEVLRDEQRALQDWNNRGVCDDDLLDFRP